MLEAQWGIAQRCRASSKSARVADWAPVVSEDNVDVLTETGSKSLSRALVDEAARAPKHVRRSAYWKKLIAGLRFDGFEVRAAQAEVGSGNSWDTGQTKTATELVRMLPSDLPGLDFREAESEA